MIAFTRLQAKIAALSQWIDDSYPPLGAELHARRHPRACEEQVMTATCPDCGLRHNMARLHHGRSLVVARMTAARGSEEDR